jgi:chromatin assembly factor 1 subunit A
MVSHFPDSTTYTATNITVEDNQIRTPIDPFSSHYWDAPIPAGLMEPPRMPLNAIKSTSAGMNGPNKKPANLLTAIDTKKSVSQGSSGAQQPKKLVSMENMPAFKEAVHGSELSKLGLIEVLNKQFPKISKSTIKHTLETIAKRVGTKEAEKRWVLIEETEAKI